MEKGNVRIASGLRHLRNGHRVLAWENEELILDFAPGRMGDDMRLRATTWCNGRMFRIGRKSLDIPSPSGGDSGFLRGTIDGQRRVPVAFVCPTTAATAAMIAFESGAKIQGVTVVSFDTAFFVS